MKKIIYAFGSWMGCLFVMPAMLIVASCEKEQRGGDFVFDDGIYQNETNADEISFSLKELNRLYKGNDIVLNERQLYKQVFITGVVTSAAVSGNVPVDGIIIEDNRVAIGVLLNENASFKIGDLIRVNIEAGTLTDMNRNVVVSGVNDANVEVLAENNAVTPRTITIAELAENSTDYVGSLVKVVDAEVLDHQSSETFQGVKNLDDGTGGIIQLYTSSSAAFAHEEIPRIGHFTGIVQYGADGSTIQLWMRNYEDVEEDESPYAAGFPEIFDTPLTKNAYALANVDLASGNWTLDGVTLVEKTDPRPINEDGTKGIQFNQNNSAPLYLQMNFDVYRGASKVTISHGSYGTDPGCTWRLEYSTDSGLTWNQTGEDIIADNKTTEIVEFDMDIQGPVRFRVHKLALGSGNNGRLNLDDFTIYNNNN